MYESIILSGTDHDHRRVGETLRDIRKAAGLSQMELADKLNTSQSVISAVERGGISRVGIDFIGKWSQACGQEAQLSIGGPLYAEPIIHHDVGGMRADLGDVMIMLTRTWGRMSDEARATIRTLVLFYSERLR